ncbi:phage tail tape measure protein [Globicatella sp. PHS-GS-PNBC-21-1553]|uniref:phage tail protein n=1 Tax=Globicatella sp. PHS-GS-PNBC-21-1553 TaxID=2885764 RepID=UPI00298ED82C|nr:phage tail tape measure protein [Globicatella sp. PHS-GS-PNBC-21-1553]WPC08013.1 phage tail tape measure protein [Globicatella sp. PHS-GS-PNBC-21-1553]
MNVFEIFGTIGLKDEATKGLDGVVGKAQDSSSKLVSIFKKTAAVVGAVFAVDKAINFGKMAVEAAATAQATEAQFQQVFSGIEKEAQKGLNKVAKDVGSLPNRIKPAFNQIAAFAKVTGMDASESLSFAERATRAAADSAAWYDQSIEQTTETLKSYLKGNYQVADNLGILSTETTRNAAATELFGQKFKDLSGLQQQEVLLKMYEDANRVSGAMGQAAREADGWENVMGNLKSAWENFLAVVGAPLLSMLIPIMQGLTDKMQKFAEWVPTAQKALSDFWDEFTNSTLVQSAIDVFNLFKDAVKDLLDNFLQSEGFSNFNDLLVSFKDTILDIDLTDLLDKLQQFIEKWGPLIAGIFGAIIAFQVIMSVIAIVQGVISGLSLAIAFLTSPIGLVVLAIGALIAAGVWLWQNWETLGPQLTKVWNDAKQWISNAIQGIIDWFIKLWTDGSKYVSDLASDVTKWFTDMWNKANQKATDIYNSVAEWFGKIPGKIKEKWNEAVKFLEGINLFEIGQNIVQGLWDGIANMWDGLMNWFGEKVGGLVDKAQSALSIFSPSRKMRDLVGRMIPRGIQVGAEEEFPALERSVEDNLNKLTDIRPMINGHIGVDTRMLQSRDDTNYFLMEAMDIIIRLLEKISNKTTVVEMNGRIVAEEVRQPLNELNELYNNRQTRIRGGEGYA